MATEESPSLRLRSIYVSPPGALPYFYGDAEPQVGPADGRVVSTDPANSSTDELKCQDGANNKDAANPFQLPASTHSLLFTENVCSLPYYFAIAIALISYICLGLALVNNISNGGSLPIGTSQNPFRIPGNVSASVRVAQYISILVALLMEEEIPTGLHLLRQIQVKDFQKKVPHQKYWKFVLASVIRILSGYFFLFNVFVVLIQATGVIEIFYDVLALQFVQQLDDIAFSLAKIDVLGKRMQRACTAPAFRMNFEEQKTRCKKSDALLRALYFLNLGALLSGMIVVTLRQTGGSYQCNSITVNFLGDQVWDPALAFNTTSGEWDEWPLFFGYFSGVYESDSSKSHGRPVYKERRKFDRAPYELKVPAEIRYCQEIKAWVMTHEHIRKNLNDESGCNWLLRSPETEEYDLLNVAGDWQIWIGVISTTEVFTACNTCSETTDCNLNGKCVDGKCECYNGSGAQYLGMHCETRLSDSCRTVMGEERNETFSIAYSANRDGQLTLFEEYSRPIYMYIEGGDEVAEDDIVWLVYTGNRWFGFWLNPKDYGMTVEDVQVGTTEFHAFWDENWTENRKFISAPTQESSPVGVDWYQIGERGSQFGPFGALNPVQLYNQTGRGYFRCADSYIPPNDFIESHQEANSSSV